MDAALKEPPGREIDIAGIRKLVVQTIVSIAPGFDARSIRPELPLRQQIDLDSMDWLNVIAVLQDRLQIHIPESDHDRLDSLDSIADYVVSRRAQMPAGAPQVRANVMPELPRAYARADGCVITLRQLSADDASLQADFMRRLSPESRYNRFMVATRELLPATLSRLTQVDAVHHVALAATTRRDGQEVVVGVARYIVDATGTACEFAVEVEDALQSSGLGGLLMHKLVDMARARDLKRMEGIVLASNNRMLKFMRQAGFSLRTDPADRHNVIVSRAL